MVCTRRNQKQVKALNFTTRLVCEKKIHHSDASFSIQVADEGSTPVKNAV
jgi:hypothetical protein